MNDVEGPPSPGIADENRKVDASTIERIEQAVQQYEALEKETNTGGQFVGLAALIAAGSLLIGIPAAFDGLSGGGGDDGALQLCCGGLFVAIVLGAAGATQASAHEVKLKQAMKEVSDAVNYKPNNDAKRYLVVSLFMIGGGWLLSATVGGTVEVFAVMGVILFSFGLLMFAAWLLFDTTNNNKGTKKKILAAAKSQLQSREEE